MVGISHLYILNGTFKEVGMDIAEGHDIFESHPVSEFISSCSIG